MPRKTDRDGGDAQRPDQEPLPAEGPAAPRPEGRSAGPAGAEPPTELMEQDAGEANASAVAPSAAADADSSAGDGAGHAGLDTSFIRKVLRDEERAAERARPFVPPRIGMKLGGRDGQRFEILGEIGGGAMGMVYRAQDSRLRRVVALKFLLPDERLPGPLMAHLHQEARAIAKLDHENIVRIHDVDEWASTDGGPETPFLVMEFLEGETLSALMRRSRIGLRRALEIMEAVAAGLAHAHEHDVIHRDLKPGNVFILENGKVKLLDFGLARFTQANVSGVSLPQAGTPAYMAPEQWRGQEAEQDARTDLWSAGVMLYEMLAGEHPFAGIPRAVLGPRITSDEPVPPIRERRPDLPEELEQLLARAVCKDRRRRMQSARELRDGLHELEARLQPRGPTSRAGEAMRRQLTLVSCRLVGLAGSKRQLDADDVLEVQDAFHRCCAQVFRAHGGTVLLRAGDHVLACFGHPRAHEDDSERAVRAALELPGKLKEHLADGVPFGPGPGPALGVGLHTDQVVVGGTESDFPEGPLSIEGDAPRIAAELARLAEPDAVLVSGTTDLLVHGSFESEFVGVQSLEGPTGAVEVEIHRLLRERNVPFRFDRTHVNGALPPLVGRRAEWSRLLELWEQARQGQGSCLLLRAEPGMGKSRLIRELCRHVGPEAAVPRSQCWPHSNNTAFQPIIETLQHAFGFATARTPEARSRAVDEQLGAMGLLPDHVDAIRVLLRLDVPEGSPLLLLTPDRRKEKTLEAVIACLLRTSSQSPVLAVVEDVQWADHSTQQLLGFLIDRLKPARMLLVLTSRPDFEPPWAGKPGFHIESLERLSIEESAALVSTAAGAQGLAPEVIQQLVEASDGVPLFLEELTQLFLHGDPRTVPVTLRELLLARLDGLAEPQRKLAQLAAVIGRSFSSHLLSMLLLRPEARVEEELATLVEARLLERTDEGPGAWFQFRHALIQKAAYDSMLKKDRRRRHARIANLLMERCPDIVDHRPELVAHHFTEAGQSEAAIPLWTSAGVRAHQRAAHVEAIHHLTQALRAIETAPVPSSHHEDELQARLYLGLSRVETRGYTQEAELEHDRTRQLIQAVGDRLAWLELPYWGIFSFYFARGRYDIARELAVRLSEAGQRSRSWDLVMLGQRMTAATSFIRGDILEAVELVEQALAIARVPQEERRRSRVRQNWVDPKFWVEPAVTAYAYASVIYSLQGRADLASAHMEEALRKAEQLGHPHTRAFVWTYCALGCQLRGEPRAMLALTGKVLSSKDCDFLLWRGWSFLLRCWAEGVTGDLDKAFATFEVALGRWRAAGVVSGMPHFMAMLGDLQLRRGDAEAVLDSVAEGFSAAERTGERSYLAELLRLKGEALRRLGQEEAAARCFEDALAMARSLGTGTTEIRATVSRARQLAQTGFAREGHALLAAVSARFAPGLVSVDLQIARDLLEGGGLSPGGPSPDAHPP